MTRHAKPKLSSERAQELIEEVVAADRQQARASIADGVRSAREQWLEPHVIAEALALELIAVAQQNETRGTVAARLRALADVLETRAGMH